MQRAILRNLSEESVKWVRANLAHMDNITNNERESASRKVLAVANELLAAGEISGVEAESVGKDAAPVAEDKALRDVLTELVDIANSSGMSAIAQLGEGAGEPLLREGIPLVVAGQSGETLNAKLGAMSRALEDAYAQRLAWMRMALNAIADGADAESFRARLFSDDDD